MTLDQTLYERLTSHASPGIDRAVALLTRAADRSVLWLVISLALAVAGGRTGRRAAIRGVLAIGLASLSVNTVMKAAWHRPRPPRDSPDVVRRPKSFSFPSGHTASAFAFATAVGSEIPVLGVALALGAAAVGYARIRGRVHYPSDVAAGALAGIAAAFLTRPLANAIIDHFAR